MLTFFFDGVPSKDSIANVSETNAEMHSNDKEEFRTTPIVSNVDFIVHYPYQEKDCYSCHNENSKSEIIAKQPDLCYTCHDDFAGKYKYLHGPVATGYCTICHNPHMSKQPKLLTRVGQQVCLYCHESKSVFKNDVHKELDGAECTDCHNPHGGEDRFILN
jgi:predicted CXXCH cytochrome family protein